MRDALDMAWFGLRMHLSGAWRWYAAALVALALLAGLWLSFIAPPSRAAAGIITVPSGQPLSAIADELRQERVIRSPFALKVALYLSGRERSIQAGDYEFKGPQSVFTVARRIATGDTQIVPVRVTLTEGMASFDIAQALAASLPGFDAATFEALAAPQEGYLFPDTYFFLPNMKPQEAVDRLTSNFDTRVDGLLPDISASGHTLNEIVTMASILEREARTPQDQAIVAGILWHRIALNMRLQVDAPFGYLHQQDNYQPTQADTESSSPYNTYRNAGLPPGPISNPGLGAIQAALNPASTTYLYYLTGKDGTMHYATTFAQHEQNIKDFL